MRSGRSQVPLNVKRIAEVVLSEPNGTVEQIGYEVGYENTAFFRRVFKRTTRLTPGAYRRKFQMPEFEVST